MNGLRRGRTFDTDGMVVVAARWPGGAFLINQARVIDQPRIEDRGVAPVRIREMDAGLQMLESNSIFHRGLPENPPKKIWRTATP